MENRGGIALGLTLGTLGLKTKGRDVIGDPQYFADLFNKHKAIGFINLQPTDDQHIYLLESLYQGDSSVAPNAEILKNLNHERIQNVENWAQRDYFVYQNWHVDHSFFEHTTSLISMRMKSFKCPKERGQTHLVSLIDMYESLPDWAKGQLETAEFESWTGADNFTPYRHPALRTHPVTGETSLYWGGADTRLVGGNTKWFEQIKNIVMEYLLDQSNWWTWEWSEGDVLVWDNRCLIHSFSPGWERNERIFDRGSIGHEKPFYRPSDKVAIGLGAEFQGPNPDHIPLVFTHGIYGLRGLESNYQKVTLIHVGENPNPLVYEFSDTFSNRSDFSLRIVTDSESHLQKHLNKYAKHHVHDAFGNGQLYLVSKNGEVIKGYRSAQSLFEPDEFDDDAPPAAEIVQGLLKNRPEMRHAGHFWHYPDWFKHQKMQNRPWDYRNLQISSPNERPSEDYLVQYAVDIIFACFNHYSDDAGRKRIVERIHEYLSYMIDIGEYRSDR